jgi:hypothetical protein
MVARPRSSAVCTAHQAKGLTWDEARRIAAGIATAELMATRERATAADE